MSGPLMWNLLLDLLPKLLKESAVGVHIVVLVAFANSAEELECMINPVLDTVVKWGTNHMLRFRFNAGDEKDEP